jgi:hypothetical protein
MDTSLGDPSGWAEFGLIGLVVFALFTIGSAGGWVLFKFIEKLLDGHRDERSEWKKQDDEVHSKTVNAITAQTDAIKEVKTELRVLSDRVLDRISPPNEPPRRG